VKPERIPTIFKEGIEIDLFLQIVTFMKNHINTNMDLCYKMLIAFPKVKRFEIVIKSLIAKEKKDLKSLIDAVNTNATYSKESLEELNKLSSALL